jgi:NarL family two-component system response regulator LiaR
MRQGLAALLRVEPDMEIAGEASDGESAVSMALDLRPDVVLMDIGMPGMDGIQATRTIHNKIPEITIIGLSMFVEKEKAAAIKDAGAVNYLEKSGPSEALIAAIRACRPPREKSAGEIVAALRDAIGDFSQRRTPSDDITAVIVKATKPSAEP